MLNNHWAADAFVASFIHSFCVIYASSSADIGTVTALRYGPQYRDTLFRVEFIAIETAPCEVAQAIQSYSLNPGETHGINVFHETGQTKQIVAEYASLGYTYEYTNAVLGMRLPAAAVVASSPIAIHEVATRAQVEFVNATHQQDQPMRPQLIGDAQIRPFYAEFEAKAVGWAMLITAYPGVAYLSDMFTLPLYRRRGVARSLLARLQIEAAAAGAGHLILVPSFTAWNYYQKLGYEPLVSFSVFKPVSVAVPSCR